MDLSAPSPAKAQQDVPVPPPPPKKGTAPTTTFEALDVTGRTADRQRLEAANASFNRGEYDKAALAAWELMNDPKMAPLQLESQYLLGKTLYRMGQYHAALGEFSQILARGKDTKFFSKSLELVELFIRRGARLDATFGRPKIDVRSYSLMHGTPDIVKLLESSTARK